MKLFNEYDALNDEGKKIDKQFQDLVETFLLEKSALYSTIELEHILMQSISCTLCEIRIKQAIQKRRNMVYR